MRRNLLNELNVDLSADPAGEGMSRAAFLNGGAEKIVKETEKANKLADGIEEEDEDELEEETDEDVEDSDDTEEDEDEEVIALAEYEKTKKDLDAARKETRHLKKLLKNNGIDLKSGAKVNPEDDGPSAREVNRFNRAVRSELKAAGFNEKLARLLVAEFDIDEDEDDDYISDRIAELKEDYSDFLAPAEPVKKKVRKVRSDLGQTHNSPEPKKLNSTQMRMKAAGLPYN